MRVEIREETVAALPEYGTVPIACQLNSRLRVEPVQSGLGGLRLVEEPVGPCVKEYDAIAGEGPAGWGSRWGISRWGVLAAFAGEHRVGGAVVAWRTEGLDMLAGREDLAALWDLRVHPDWRGQSVGHRLFARAVDRARERHCRQVVIETQNVNVSACRFYARQGCTLGTIRQGAYPGLDEIQLLWYKAV